MTTFTSTTTIIIADNATEQQSLVVSGLTGTITSVSVTLGDLSHGNSDNLDFLLVGPNGTANLEFWSDAGGSAALSPSTVFVADSGATALPDNSAISGGTTYRPADYGGAETASNWAGLTLSVINHPQTNGSATFASVFNGLSANGTWTLWVRDDAVAASGLLPSWSLDIISINHAPVITSNGGGDTATITLPEGTTALTTVTATDSDSDSLSYSITGGDDQTKFQINPATGALSFVAIPNFKIPTDSDHNNSYIVQVSVSDGSLSDAQTITVNVTDLPPTITSDGGGDSATINIAENMTAVTNVAASDAPGTVLTYSIIGGADQDKFQINPATGALSFVAAPNFEIPTDSDHNNSYIVQVRASDGSLFDDQSITVSVMDVLEPPPADSHGFHPLTTWDFTWHLIASGDFNHDSNTDVIWDNGHGVQAGWLMANGIRAGTLQLPFFPDWLTVGMGDFNRDGNTDIMWQNGDGLVAEWFMGDGTRQGTAVVQNMAGWHVIATGDFNKDGIGDVIWDNGAGVEGGWLMNTNGQIGGTLQLPFFPGWSVIATGDFNHDGNTDILWKNADGLVAEWFMGSGTRQGTMVIQNMTGWSAIANGDFNGDGTDDVLWRNADGATALWFMKDGQIFSTASYGTTTGWNVVTAGDFNQDGVTDIMWQNIPTADIATWEFDPSGALILS